MTHKTEDSRDRLNDPRVKVNMHLSYEDIMGQHNPVVETPDVMTPLVGDGVRRTLRKPSMDGRIR